MSDELSKIIEESWQMVERRASMKPEERRAADLLEDILGATDFDPRDYPGGPPKMHDFDLCFADGRRFAVEVTTHTSEQRVAISKRMEQLNPIKAPSLKCNWQISLVEPADETTGLRSPRIPFDEIVAEIVELLERVECESLHEEVEYIPEDEGHDWEPPLTLNDAVAYDEDSWMQVAVHPVRRRFRELRIQSARCYPSKSVAEVWLQPLDGFSWCGPSDVLEAAEHHIKRKSPKPLRAKSDNADQRADEAHLFIWVPLGKSKDLGTLFELWTVEPAEVSTWPPVNRCGLDSVWMAIDSLPENPELRGFTNPILQLTYEGWSCWSREWNRHPPGESR